MRRKLKSAYLLKVNLKINYLLIQLFFVKPNFFEGDVAGSVEAIEDALSTYDKDEECKLEVVECEVGNVTESDIEVAEAFNGNYLLRTQQK